VLAVAALARAGVMAGSLGRLDDPDGYLPLARSLWEGSGFEVHGRPTAYRPPLYPILLAPLVGALPESWLARGVAALHLTLGLGTVTLVAWTASRWGLSRPRVLAASVVVALDPVLLVQGRAVMTETFAALLVAATLAGLSTRGAASPILGGVGFGLASLCRPSLLPGAALAALGALACGPGDRRARLGRAALLLLATTAMLAPWAWRNARALGRPVWTTTHGGYTLALANNPAYYEDVLDGPPGVVWSGPNQAAWFDSVGRTTLGMNEVEADRAMRDAAIATIRADPRRFVRASLARLGRFWGLAPSAAVYPGWLRLATAAWSAPLWVAAILGLARPGVRRWPGVVAPAIIMALTAVHTLYWTDQRMRAPLVPAIALIAAGVGGPPARRRRSDLPAIGPA